ncbi:MAG: 50S ribosomal protein L11 methyltransferase, partial [Acutalibacteraceae bacterium]
LCGNLTDKVNGKFDVIVANIVADIIINFCEYVSTFMKSDAVFITSGIIDSREDDVLEAFKKYDFKVLERREDSGWLCFVTKVL